MSIYHPDDQARIEKAEADLNKAREGLKVAEMMVAGSRLAAAQTWRNWFLFLRAKGYDPITSAGWGTLLWLLKKRR